MIAEGEDDPYNAGMADTYTHLRILIACPDDVAEERGIARDLINEFNRSWSRRERIWLESISWETDIHPDFADDPQSAINGQIGDDYDIFVGILWNRFGTPTRHAGSGTEQEFERAYSRFNADRRSVKLMMYFSRAPVEDPYSLDTKQMDLVRQFGEKVSTLGGLYKRYASHDEFGDQFRIHLAAVVQEWGEAWGSRVGNPNRREPPEGHVASEAQEGLVVQPGSAGQEGPQAVEVEGVFNLIERGAENVEVVTKATERIGEAIRGFGERIQGRTEQLKGLSGAPDIASVRIARKNADDAAEDMLQFVGVVEEEVPTFSKSYYEALDAYARLAVLLSESSESGPHSAEQTLVAIRQWKASLVQSREPLLGFRRSIEATPSVSSDLISARGKALAALDSLGQEWDKAIDLSSDVEEMLKGIVERSTGSSNVGQPTVTVGRRTRKRRQ